MAFRKTFYESLEQLQADPDHYLNFYNCERAHQGYRIPPWRNRTPYQTLLDGLEVRLEQEVKPHPSGAAQAKIGGLPESPGVRPSPAEYTKAADTRTDLRHVSRPLRTHDWLILRDGMA